MPRRRPHGGATPRTSPIASRLFLVIAPLTFLFLCLSLTPVCSEIPVLAYVHKAIVPTARVSAPRTLQESDYKVLLRTKYRVELLDERGLSNASELDSARQQLSWNFTSLPKVDLSDIWDNGDRPTMWGRVRQFMTISNIIAVLASLIVVLSLTVVIGVYVVNWAMLLNLGRVLWTIVIFLWYFMGRIPLFIDFILYSVLFSVVRYGYSFDPSIAHLIAFPAFLFAPVLLFILSKYHRLPTNPSGATGLLDYACACMVVGAWVFDSTIMGVAFAALLHVRNGFLCFAPMTGSFVFGFHGKESMDRILRLTVGMVLVLAATFSISAIDMFRPGLSFFGLFCLFLNLLIRSTIREPFYWFWNTMFLLAFAISCSGGAFGVLPSGIQVACTFLVFWILEKQIEVPMHVPAAFWLRLLGVGFVLFGVGLFSRSHPELFLFS
eukprot:ANDGO_05773.mRNA.1 hypothetical protein